MTRHFTEEEPREDFVWVFRNVDGSESEYPTTMANYLKYKALYGVPQTRWRKTTDAMSAEQKGDSE